MPYRAKKIEKLKMNVLIWNSFSLDLGVQIRWYLDWGSFRAWKTFSKILFNRCWLNIDIETCVGKNSSKIVKKATVDAKGGVFLLYWSWGHHIRVRSSPMGIYYPAKTIRIISTILLKIFVYAHRSFFSFLGIFVHFLYTILLSILYIF